jgi:hypothetical protein
MNNVKLHRRAQRRAESKQVALACVAAGVLSQLKLHVGRKASTNPVHHGSNIIAEPLVLNHVAARGARLVDSVKLTASTAGLVVNSESKAESFSDGIGHVIHGACV